MVQEVPSPNHHNRRGVVSPAMSQSQSYPPNASDEAMVMDQVMMEDSSSSSEVFSHSNHNDRPTILNVPPPTPPPGHRNHSPLLNSSPVVCGNDASPSESSSDDPIVLQNNHRSIVGDHGVMNDWRDLFEEVRSGLDNKQGSTVGWKQSHESLGNARKLLAGFISNPREMRISTRVDEMNEVRFFIEHNMHKIIQILLDQQCHKLTDDQRQCVVQSLQEANLICAYDLNYLSRRCISDIAVSRELDLVQEAMPPYQFVMKPESCGDDMKYISSSLFVTYQLLNKARHFYCSGNSKQRHGNHYWNASNSNFSSIDVRLSLMWKFQSMSGFRNLANIWHRIIVSYRDGAKRAILPTVSQMMAVLVAVEDLCRDWDDFESDKRQRSKKSSSSQQLNPSQDTKRNPVDAVQAVCNVVMHYLGTANEDELKHLHSSSSNSQMHNADDLCSVRNRIYRIIDNLARANPEMHWRLLTQFFTFWREFAYKFMSANSLLLRLQGWTEISELITKAAKYRPPPRCYQVVNAGIPFVNGIYEYSGIVDPLGYAILAGGSDVQYTYKVRVKNEGDEKQDEVKCITLFRCTMRSNAKWWFLSEADEDQPGTDKDIDYYQQKSVKLTSSVDEPFLDLKHELEYVYSIPPRDNWNICRNSREPSPSLLPTNGLMVPQNEDKNTLEHQLGRWIVEKRVIEELVLGFESLSVHREVVNRSLPVLQFLAGMCTLDQRLKFLDSIETQEQDLSDLSEYALQPHHLHLAWKACLSKTDVAVSTEMMTLLVSLLPYLNEKLALNLLDEVDSTLGTTLVNSPRQQQSAGSLIEVAEFCGALVASCSNSSNASLNLAPIVRRKVLQILFHLLMEYPYDPSNSTLPCVLEQIQNALKQELTILTDDGNILRNEYLTKCLDALQNIITSNQRGLLENVDHEKDLRVVNVTQFILQTCPNNQRSNFIATNDSRLPQLLFNETCSYIRRISRINQEIINSNIESAVRSRLNVLQYVFSQNKDVFLSVEQLKALWELCRIKYVYQELMLELLQHLSLGHSEENNIIKNANRGQKAATDAFKMLFCCSDTMPFWNDLTQSGYVAFSSLYRLIEDENESKGINDNIVLDTLWRIYMTCKNGNVAREVMRHLLAVYNAQKVISVKSTVGVDFVDDDDKCIQKVKVARMQPASPDSSTNEPSNRWLDPGRAFLFRILDCLRQSLQNHNETISCLDSRTINNIQDVHLDDRHELAAERCVRLLHAALEWDTTTSSSQLSSISESKSINSLILAPDSKSISMDEVQQDIPHGHMAQSCYRNISVVIRRNHAGSKQQTERFIVKLHPIESMTDFRQKVAFCTDHPAESMTVLLTNSSGTGDASAVAKEQSQLELSEGSEILVLLTPSPVASDSQLATAHSNDQDTDTAQTSVFNSSYPTNHGTSSIVSSPLLNLSNVFGDDDNGINYGEQLFEILLRLLEVLPHNTQLVNNDDNNDVKLKEGTKSTFHLVWDLLLTIPTNAKVLKAVHSIALGANLDTSESWNSLIRLNNHSTVYTMQTIEALLSPAAEPYILYNRNHRKKYLLLDDESKVRDILQSRSASFREAFITSGGFRSVLDYFCQSAEQSQKEGQSGTTTLGYCVALRILMICLSGSPSTFYSKEGVIASLDAKGNDLLNNTFGSPSSVLTVPILRFLILVSPTLPDSALCTSLDLLRILLTQKHICNVFSNDLGIWSKAFVMRLLLWPTATIRHRISRVILSVEALSLTILSWYIDAVRDLDYEHEEVVEFFKVLQALIDGDNSVLDEITDTNEIKAIRNTSIDHLHKLCEIVGMKLARYPRPNSTSSAYDDSGSSSLVLCGLLRALKALLTKGGIICAKRGSSAFKMYSKLPSWCPNVIKCSPNSEPIVNLIGFIFDGFLLSENLTSHSLKGTRSVIASVPICRCKESRQLAFENIFVAISLATDNSARFAVIMRMSEIIDLASLNFRNKFGNQASIGTIDLSSSNHGGNNSSINTNGKFSGLRNQGCTCYMNSLLQQLFMMHGLREQICDAPLPYCLREIGESCENDVDSPSIGGNESFQYERSLIGKHISLVWESGVKYEAIVQSFSETSKMHTIIYLPLSSSNVASNSQSNESGQHSYQLHHLNHNDPSTNTNSDIILPELPEEFCLHEGRPGRETGAFEIVRSNDVNFNCESETNRNTDDQSYSVNETEDQKAARILLEELQRTFVYLSEQQGRCYDPRSLVEASSCLKLEFDVWQQNDASEYAMKLFDRLELPLKKWAPQQFNYLTETFGLKQTKQKICKECGLKTNREETLMSIDLQIRGKSSVHESLSTFCEVDLMCGDNQVNCDQCKAKRDTVLRTAISQLPNVLILSLKRFDLDFTTFETVKLNSRCAFGQTLNMKQYTLEGIEAREKMEHEEDVDFVDDDDVVMNEDTKSVGSSDELNDEDYEYKLVGVLVHAGVAQGGHYYSYIKDRSSKESEGEVWYRFDDEDVTPFDPKNIETECFGGKIKKETKWPNGQVTTTETEQFANALMLFYEKVKPALTGDATAKNPTEPEGTQMISGYDAFQPDVDKTNTSHSWKTFLFDSELQSFLKKLLSYSYSNTVINNSKDVMDIASPETSLNDFETGNWRLSVLQVALSFFFDVLLHTVDRESRNLNDWTHTLILALHSYKDGAKWFMNELIQRTSQVSSNWLRTYYIECPEHSARTVANKVFFNAFLSVVSCTEEQDNLESYAQSMKDLWNDVKSVDYTRSTAASPMSLDGDPNTNPSSSLPSLLSKNRNNSTLGIFISYISSLLEIATRRWPYCSELCQLLKDLSWIKEAHGGEYVRNLMCTIKIPSQIVCLITREEAPESLVKMFPGASLSVQQSELLSRGVCDSSSHLQLISGIQTQTSSVPSAQVANFQLTSNEVILLLEAICGMLKIKGGESTPLIYHEGGQDSFSARSNSRSSNTSTKLSPQAKAALTVIFNEFRNQQGHESSGLSQNDIQKYMERCGFENVHPQKIASLLNKYSTDPVEGGKVNRKLNLEGFLSYYRDSSTSNDSQVRSDLHMFGFRQDLSRRPEHIRMVKTTNNEQTRLFFYDNLESIALDVASHRKRAQFSELIDIALNSFAFYSKAFNICESLAAYILATATYDRKIDQLLFDALYSLNCAPTNWEGTQIKAQCISVVLAVPDAHQRRRIEYVMTCSETSAPHGTSGIGLLVAAKTLLSRSSSQRFASEYRYADAVDRYIDVVSELYLRLDSVKKWMDERQHEWSWIQRWKQRVEHGTRGTRLSDRDADSNRYGRRMNSDSDTGGFVPDSDEDDTEHRYSPRGHKEMKPYRNVIKAPSYVYVRCAGLDSVNGVYKQIQAIDKAPAYERDGLFRNTNVKFTLYRWPMQGSDTKSWFISILPQTKTPGSQSDIDLYASKGSDDIPPESGWHEMKEHGIAPGPTISYAMDSPSIGDLDPSDSQDEDEIVEEDTLGDIQQMDQWFRVTKK